MTTLNVELLELRIAKFLRVGTLIAGALMLIGWIGMVSGNDDPFVALQNYEAVGLSSRLNFSTGWPDGFTLISYGGLLALISLPILRVFLTAVLFFRNRETILGFIAAFVLVALFASFQLGLLE